MRVVWGLAVVGLLAGPALAQQQSPPLETSISVESFQPPSGPGAFATVEGASVLPHLRYSAGAVFHAASGGVNVFTVDSEDNLRTRQEVVKSQLWLDAVAALGFKRFQFGVAVPILLSMEGDGIDERADPTTAEHLNQTALGDVRIDGKWLAAGSGGTDTSVALAAAVTVPSSGGKDFVGEDMPTFRPRIIVSDTFGRLHIGINFGAVLRSPRTVFSSELGQELSFGLGAAVSASKSLALFAEVFGRNGMSNDLDSTPVEAGGGLKLRRGSLHLMLGGGAGVVRGLGAPDWRAFAGIMVATGSVERRDTDGDGVADDDEGKDIQDRSCATMAEDLDGYDDHDGCPELDNDGDGLLDGEDKCPHSTEDPDGFEDGDGCPDRDDDKDGVDDVKDACAGAKEDGLGVSPKDGCPNDRGDADKDGVVDTDDRCADEAEDKDGFEDDDGCIDADDDADGIIDQIDACPKAPEDKDGFEDADGCTDVDNDRDGVLDAADRCANEAETINGVKDDDGCPDKGGKQLASLGEGGVVVMVEAVTWNNKDAPAPKAKALLDQVARVMLAADADVETWSIVVSVEASAGKSDAEVAAIGTSRAEALALALVARGVPEAKLTSRGVASDKADTEITIAKRRTP